MIKNKGFTLIELLVVISIIGILSSIVLTSLNTARDKARDAAIQATVSSTRSEAEIYYSGSDSNGYAGLCDEDGIQNLLASIENQLPPDTNTDNLCESNSSTFAIYAPLNSVESNYCVDSNGFAGIGNIAGSDSGGWSCQGSGN